MNFETMIRDAMNKGMSAEDIAETIGQTLNKIEAENAPAIKRKKVVDEMSNALWANVRTENPSFEDAATMAALYAAEKYGHWTAEMIKDYEATTLKQLEMSARIMSSDPMEMLVNLLSEAESAMTPTRGKKEKRETVAPIGKTDEDKIAAFLKNL